MNRRLARWISTFAFAAFGLTAQACVIHESPGVNRGYGYGYQQGGSVQGGVHVGSPNPYYVSSMPPEPLYESMSSSPGYGYVWTDGYWDWNGYEWVWNSGRWVQDQSGQIYVQSYYDWSDDGRYVYYPPHWSRPERIPERVKVVDHRDGRPSTGYHPPRPTGDRPSRDHRDPVVVTPPSGGGRDHRTPTRDPDRSSPPRDHRTPVVDKQPDRDRDHRTPRQPTRPPRKDNFDPGNGPRDNAPPPREHRDPPKVPRKQPVRNPSRTDKAPVRDHKQPAQPTRPPRKDNFNPGNGPTKSAPPRKTPAKRPSRDHRSSLQLDSSPNPMLANTRVAMISSNENAMLDSTEHPMLTAPARTKL